MNRVCNVKEILQELETQVLTSELPKDELELLILSVGFLKSFYFKGIVQAQMMDEPLNKKIQDIQNKFSRLEQLQHRLWAIQRKLIAD